ncbi:unnamed protein product [Leuciscus chuanchicus]
MLLTVLPFFLSFPPFIRPHYLSLAGRLGPKSPHFWLHLSVTAPNDVGMIVGLKFPESLGAGGEMPNGIVGYSESQEQVLSLFPPLPGAVLNDNSDITSSYMSDLALGLPV